MNPSDGQGYSSDGIILNSSDGRKYSSDEIVSAPTS